MTQLKVAEQKIDRFTNWIVDMMKQTHGSYFTQTLLLGFVTIWHQWLSYEALIHWCLCSLLDFPMMQSFASVWNAVCLLRMMVNFEIAPHFLHKSYGHQTLPKTSQWCILWKTCVHCNIRLDFRGSIILRINRIRNLKLWAALLTFWPLVIDCWR